MTAEPRRTPLYEAHRGLGAKLIDFGGWMMPVNYPPGILEEHHTTRRSVGVFDVCHMGELHFQGPRAAEAVQRLVTNDVGSMVDGRAMYTVACHPSGGIVDDLIVYRVRDDHYLLVVNASNIGKDFSWALAHVGGWCQIRNASDETGLIAFQGPRAQEALATLTEAPIATLGSYRFLADVKLRDWPVQIARTGYTGEDGFEIFCNVWEAEDIWFSLLEAADRVSGKPVGLGARDTLRLEARLSLYGNDLDDDTTPLEAGLGWVVKPDAGEFIGREALVRQKEKGLTRKLVGFVMVGRGIARHGYPIHGADGEKVGLVTSGTVGPTVGKNIGLGYVPATMAEPGTRLVVDCRGKMAEAEVVKGPFYRRQTA